VDPSSHNLVLHNLVLHCSVFWASPLCVEVPGQSFIRVKFPLKTLQVWTYEMRDGNEQFQVAEE